LVLLIIPVPSLAQDSFWKDTGLALHLGLLSLAQKRLEDYRPASYKDKERALLALAYIHLRRNEKEEANTCLAQIPPSSPYYEAAQALSWAREMKVEEAEGVLPPTSAPFLVFEKTLTQSPVAALERMTEKPFDIVVTDFRMKEMSGMQVLKKIRALYPRTKAIIITGYGRIETATEAFREGGFNFIAKPFRLDELRKSIFRAVQSIEADASFPPLTPRL